MSSNPWEDGALADAFDVDQSNVSKNASKTPPPSGNGSQSSGKKPPKPGTSTEQDFESKRDKNEKQQTKQSNVEEAYPTDTKGEAVESLKRAANIEEYENFKKVASAIEEEHPDALNDFEELEKVSYVVGRNIAEGIYDELQDQA